MNDAKLSKIRALLAKAEATDFPAEAETYRDKAYALITEYGIDEALAFAEGKTRDEIGRAEFLVEAPYALDKVVLLVGVYSALGAQVVRFSRGKDQKVVIVGYQSDLDRAEILYTSLLVQAFCELQASWARSVSDRKTFLSGFANEIHRRLKEAAVRAAEQTQESAAGTSTALVLVDRKAAVQHAFAEAFPNTKKVKRTLRGDGYAAGKAAGARADLGGKRVGGHRRALA